jgi:ferredoxin--NADP+ reductase
MYKITFKEDLTPNIHHIKIDSPAVAKRAQPGQFIILMVDEKGERIPLTIADWDSERVSIVFMEVGKTTFKLATYGVGDSIFSFVGPLGMPTHIEKFGTVICVAGGFATATIVPIARAMKEAGNKVISIMGFRTKGLVFWEDRLDSVSDKLIVTTDDGSYGRKGLVTEPLKELLESESNIDRVLAIGPSVMMRFCSKTTEPYGIKTVVSLNPIMVDGTGMCGCCRVEVGGVTKFACVDGPDFDGHQVNWDLLFDRQRAYLKQEKEAIKMWEHGYEYQFSEGV